MGCWDARVGHARLTARDRDTDQLGPISIPQFGLIARSAFDLMGGLYDFDPDAQIVDDLAIKWDDPDNAAAAGAGSSGTLATTNAADTSAASGTTTVLGTLARTNANDTSVAAGTTTVTGSLATTNADDTLAASGSAGSVTGTLATTNANDTSAAAGTTTVLGALGNHQCQRYECCGRHNHCPWHPRYHQRERHAHRVGNRGRSRGRTTYRGRGTTWESSHTRAARSVRIIGRDRSSQGTRT